MTPEYSTIPLRPSFVNGNASAAIEDRLQRIVRSVKFEVLEDQRAFRILGPDMGYHSFDPHLPAVLSRFNSGMTSGGILSFRTKTKAFDLCFEDSWSGYFLADHLADSGEHEDLVLIHLDDHTDMMPTLLTKHGDSLKNPITDKTFDPREKDDWESAIYSGCVNIGSFITPLFYASRSIHVRHINNVAASEHKLENVARESAAYPEIPGLHFASIRRSCSDWRQSAGTYLASSVAERALDDIPRGRVVVHIDLDYFINDFNGNERTGPYVPRPELIAAARLKIDRFFDALSSMRLRVDRWIIATSPGFCSACHWEWLLATIGAAIEELQLRVPT